MASPTTSPMMLTCTLPDGVSYVCARVDGGENPGEPAVHHLLTCARPIDRRARCLGEARSSFFVTDDTDADTDQGSDSTSVRGFVPPRPLPSRVFVKWAAPGDGARGTALAREASFYTNELRSLQGVHVPHFYGHYVCLNKAEKGEGVSSFVISVFELCEWANFETDRKESKKVNSDEYFRQYVLAACALHAVGVAHNQLVLSQRTPSFASALQSLISFVKGAEICVDPHVLTHRASASPESPVTIRPMPFPSLDGMHTQLIQPLSSAATAMRVRVLDFTQATRHRCTGARLRAEGSSQKTFVWVRDANGRLRCDEEVDETLDCPCQELARLEACLTYAQSEVEVLAGEC